MCHRLTAAVLRAPCEVFDNTPSGRMLNRFIKDMVTLDESVPRVMSTLAQFFLSFLAVFVVIAAVTPYALLSGWCCTITTIRMCSHQPWTLVPLLAYPYYLAAQHYRWSARDLRRLESVRSRMPKHNQRKKRKDEEPEEGKNKRKRPTLGF